MALEAWHAHDPQKVTVIHQPNRGLAAARNAGIEAALRLPALQAVFFLDADNRLDSLALELFETLLLAHKEADWFYPNFDMFGLDEPQSHGGAWSLSRMAVSNICDAGSLVRKQVFDDGLRFDSTFKLGYEDWDFWLSAAQAGFAGHAVSASFFRYRKRGQSMLRDAQAEGENVAQSVRAKHRWLFQSGQLAKIYAQEWPRFAFINADSAGNFGELPTATQLTANQIQSKWWEAQVDPFTASLPQSWIFAPPQVIAHLKLLRRLGSVLLEMEASLADGQVCALHFQQSANIAFRPGLRHVDKTWESIASAAMICLPAKHLALAAASNDLMEAFEAMMARGVIAPFNLSCPDPPPLTAEAAEAAVAFLGGLVESPYNHSGLAAVKPWRKPAAIVSPEDLRAEVCKLNLGGLHLPGQGYVGPKIGIVLPILRFGGVEKCAVALAAALRNIGAKPHLFLYGDDEVSPEEWLYEPFEAIHQMTRSELRDWSGARYLGTADGRAPAHWLQGRLAGPLTAMDVVINAGCGPFNAIAAALRKRGVKTVTWEHLVEDTTFGRPNGTPYLALSNEGAFDLVVTCSHALLHWLAGQGIDQDKLLALPNGPGFPAAFAGRPAPNNAQPLRVGFMGRLDYQKGFDRYLEIASALQGPNLRFSMVGAAVLDGVESDLPHWLERHPLAKTPEALAHAYDRIDILLMPSRAEGLPLAILEAQRAGVLPIVSNVGAVHEAIDDGVNGILLPANAVVKTAIDVLQRLVIDREQLRRLTGDKKADDRWADNARRLLSALGLTPLA